MSNQTVAIVTEVVDGLSLGEAMDLWTKGREIHPRLWRICRDHAETFDRWVEEIDVEDPELEGLRVAMEDMRKW